ncbi:cytochrome c family protein [Emcibacter sp.]|uniref:c-type cytochrome n=1 Tax=Emcibacter sp. TaxID=1979954 RepID=UPI002AA63F25|nr:cytochrome c family protein [Emcibacter sp.]
MNLLLKMALASVIGMVAATTASAEGDATLGQKTFKKKCAACHTVDKGGKKKVGPNLYAIVGREAAKFEGFKYSDAMVSSGLTWDETTLDHYLTQPKALVPKTKMIFAGLKKEQDREDLIAYLKTLAD